jgi:VanZ family protein
LTKVVRLTRMAAWVAGFAIIVLSIVPGRMRPHVFGNDFAEHFVAYFIAGGLFASGYLRPMQLLFNGVLLAICAGSLEFVQLWIPARTASAREFAASAIGAWVGLLIIASIRRARERKLVVSYK